MLRRMAQLDPEPGELEPDDTRDDHDGDNDHESSDSWECCSEPTLDDADASSNPDDPHCSGHLGGGFVALRHLERQAEVETPVGPVSDVDAGPTAKHTRVTFRKFRFKDNSKHYHINHVHHHHYHHHYYGNGGRPTWGYNGWNGQHLNNNLFFAARPPHVEVDAPSTVQVQAADPQGERRNGYTALAGSTTFAITPHAAQRMALSVDANVSAALAPPASRKTKRSHSEPARKRRRSGSC